MWIKLFILVGILVVLACSPKHTPEAAAPVAPRGGGSGSESGRESGPSGSGGEVIKSGDASVAQGSWSSVGGGGGVACFPTKALADRVRALVDLAQPVDPGLLDQMTSFRIVERWEAENISPRWPWWATTKGKTWQDIDQELLTKLAEIAPIFVYRLSQGQDSIRFADWHSQAGLKRIEDVHLERPLPSDGTCLLVQIADRYQEVGVHFGDGPPKKTLGARVFVDRELFGRLPIMDQAMLMQHERLYLLGLAIGHPDSDLVRYHVRFEYSNGFPFTESLPFPFASSQIIDFYRLTLERDFGDSLIYFSDELVPDAHDPYGSGHRFMAFLRFLNETRAVVGECRKKSDRKTCLDAILKPENIQDKLDDEQALLYLAHYYYDTVLKEFNSEFPMDPRPSLKARLVSDNSVNYLCGRMEKEKDRFRAKVILAKAMNYCKGFAMNLRKGMVQ